MNQEIKKLGEIIMTFTWFDDNKVYVKYFRNGEEIKEFSNLSYNDRQLCKDTTKEFEKNHHDLTMWSY